MTHAHAKSHVPAYVAIYLSLLVLVGVTVGVAHIKTGPLAFPIAMAVAWLKTILIVAVFMHLKDEVPLIRLFAITSILWLGILFSILMGDYMNRHDARAAPRNSAIGLEVGDSHTAAPAR